MTTRRLRFRTVPVSFYLRGLCPSFGDDSIVGHRAPRSKEIEYGDTDVANLIPHDPAVKNDFEPGSQGRAQSTGMLPFLALDLPNEGAPGGTVRRLYRHDAESFTWCLIYICVCKSKDQNRQIGTLSPHPLSSWFTNMDACLGSKINLKLHEFPLHQNIHSIVSTLHINWTKRYARQLEDNTNLHVSLTQTRAEEGVGGVPLPSDLIEPEGTVQTTEPYQELSDQEWFKRVYGILIKANLIIPPSQAKVFLEIINLVKARYPFVKYIRRQIEQLVDV
jgi:hypothetical protein